MGDLQGGLPGPNARQLRDLKVSADDAEIALVDSILTLHQDSVSRAASAVNQALVLRNLLIGAHIVEFEQQGEDRARYGIGLLASVATDRKSRSVPGCSAEMLGRSECFIVLSLSCEIGFDHRRPSGRSFA